MPQLEGLNTTLESLEGDGRLAELPAALVELARGLARELDADAESSAGRAALWREYRAALSAVMEAANGASDDDSAQFILSIQTPGRAKVGHAKES